ncbi:hypothetical protein L7F22_001432 [Adiantum nelumboides]|nr:hypothetical protein [Adiantum nelumboides]
MGLLWLKYSDLRDETNADLMVVSVVENADLMELLWLKNADLRDEKNADLMVEELILGKAVEGPKGLQRESRIIQTIMKQILSGLQGLHATGIVHRDIKPQNIIFSQDSRTFKIIDLGAAADLRVGINYIPKEFLLDPRYAAPEQYIMSTQTPSAPPAPVAAALSPVLWQMNSPDRFDIYSAGLIFLQMAFPNLRTDSALIQFNRQLKRCGYDMVQWRELTEPRANADLCHGFDLLDLDGGVGWELLLAMLIRGAQRDPSEAIEWVYGLLAKSGTTTVGGFTEAQLQELKEIQPKRKDTLQRNALASVLRLQRKVVRTIDETVDEISAPKKEFWWRRWIPRDN